MILVKWDLSFGNLITYGMSNIENSQQNSTTFSEMLGEDETMIRENCHKKIEYADDQDLVNYTSII